MKPTVSVVLTGYTFSWQEHGITIRASQVKVHSSDGRVTGEITVEATNEAGHPIVVYPSTTFNFTGPRSRIDLSKVLLAKYPKLPWGEMIDQLCFAVPERARQGETTSELWTSADIPDLEYLLKPILIKGVPSMVFGEKAAGKSTLALYIYTCLTLPWTDNPLGLEVPSRPVKTLLLDWELPGSIAQRNAKYLQQGMGLPPFPLYHRRCRMPLAHDLEQVQRQIDGVGAEAVIIDSLARACGGDLNKTEPANAFFEALDQLKTTALIIAQTSKDVESKRKTPYGNALFTYFARSIWELCKAETLGEDGIDLALFHRWSNLTKHFPAIGMRFNFNEHHTTVESQAVSVSDFAGKISTQQAILSELKRGALSAKELAERTGATENTVKVNLTRLKKKGRVSNPEEGMWGLTTFP